MIQVTFTFDSIEKAVATLGSLMQKNAPVPTLANPAVAPEAKSNRKPRADAGKARGSYKNAGAAPEKAGSENPPSPGVELAPAPAPEPQPPTAKLSTAPSQEGVGQGGVAAPSEAEAQTALTALFNAKGLAAAQATLGKFGVQALRHLPADKRGEFIAAANEAAK